MQKEIFGSCLKELGIFSLKSKDGKEVAKNACFAMCSEPKLGKTSREKLYVFCIKYTSI